MFTVTALFDSEVDDFLGTYESEIDKFALDLSDCVLEAARAGIEEMQSNHPYTDRTRLLTDGMNCKLFGRQSRWMKEAVIVFDAPYAKYVNDGTVKSKPYPFVPQGMTAAENALYRCVSDRADLLCIALAKGT